MSVAPLIFCVPALYQRCYVRKPKRNGKDDVAEKRKKPGYMDPGFSKCLDTLEGD